MKASQFDGTVLQHFGMMILLFLVTMITLGIGFPFIYAYYLRWETEHTVIDGKRLKFVGKGSDLFVKFLLWWILSVITLGIYSIWIGVNFLRWRTENTTFA